MDDMIVEWYESSSCSEECFVVSCVSQEEMSSWANTLEIISDFSVTESYTSSSSAIFHIPLLDDKNDNSIIEYFEYRIGSSTYLRKYKSYKLPWEHLYVFSHIVMQFKYIFCQWYFFCELYFGQCHEWEIKNRK